MMNIEILLGSQAKHIITFCIFRPTCACDSSFENRQFYVIVSRLRAISTSFVHSRRCKITRCLASPPRASTIASTTPTTLTSCKTAACCLPRERLLIWFHRESLCLTTHLSLSCKPQQSTMMGFGCSGTAAMGRQP